MKNNPILNLSLLVVILTLVFNACVPPTNEIITDIDISNGDVAYQRLYDHQDTQNIDSLLKYFNHPNPAYRLTAVNAMASLQSDKALDSLVIMLNDPILEVRTAAAYAIGQSGSAEIVDPLMNAFVNRDTVDVDNKFNATILESVGKTGNKALLDALASVSSYRTTDTLLLLGQARAIYRYATRGITSQKGTDRMVDLVSGAEYPDQVRVMAAN